MGVAQTRGTHLSGSSTAPVGAAKGRRRWARREEGGVAGAILGVLSLMSACSLEEPRRFLSWPDPAGGAFVLWADTETELLVAGDTREPLLLESLPAEAPLELWRYGASLSDLGIEPGALPSSVRCRACELLDPDQAFRVEPRSEWHAAHGDEQVRQALVADRHDRCDEYCPRWELERVPLPIQGVGVDVVRLPSNRALVLTSSGALWLIGATGPTELQCQTELTGLGTAAFRPPDQLWVQAQGGLHSLQIGGPGSCPRTSSISVPTSFRWLAVSEPPAELEIVGVGGDHTVHQYFRGRWSLLGALAAPVDRPGAEGGAVWLGGRSFAAAHRTPELLRIDQGVGTLQRIGVRTVDGSPASIAGMGAHPSLGLVLALQKVGIVTKNGADEVVLVPSRIELGGLVVYSGGLVYLDQGGTPETVHFRTGVACPGQLSLGVAALRLVRLDDGTVVAADRRFSADGLSAWAYRYYLPASCARLPPVAAGH